MKGRPCEFVKIEGSVIRRLGEESMGKRRAIKVYFKILSDFTEDGIH